MNQKVIPIIDWWIIHYGNISAIECVDKITNSHVHSDQSHPATDCWLYLARIGSAEKLFPPNIDTNSSPEQPSQIAIPDANYRPVQLLQHHTSHPSHQQKIICQPITSASWRVIFLNFSSPPVTFPLLQDCVCVSRSTEPSGVHFVSHGSPRNTGKHRSLEHGCRWWMKRKLFQTQRSTQSGAAAKLSTIVNLNCFRDLLIKKAEGENARQL